MQLGRRRLFIYYRVDAAHAQHAMAAAARAQSALIERHEGLQAMLLRRPETSDAQITLMETYARNAASEPHGVDERLQAEIEQMLAHALAGFIAGERHAEVFEPCA
jgi:hypothetical protein